MKNISIFGKHQILPGNNKVLKLGLINLLVKRELEGWYIKSSELNNEEIHEVSNENQTLDYFQSGKSNHLIVEPDLPIKPLVFKGTLLNVLPGNKFTFFVKIPLTFQLYSSKKEPDNLLKGIASKKLSDTWFGEPDNGESAFALGSEYFLNFNSIEHSEWEAICPIIVFNNSLKVLTLQRLIIRCDLLNLYKNADKIVTSEVNIEFKGSDIISSADYKFSKLFHGEKREILAEAQNTSGKKLLKINFHFIKNIYKGE